MTEITINKSDDELADLLDRAAKGERIIIRRRGKKAVMIGPADDAELLDRLEDELDRKLIDRRLKEKSKAVPLIVKTLFR
jgi:prevent-host-death family protein